jgi:hypothetical protein
VKDVVPRTPDVPPSGFAFWVVYSRLSICSKCPSEPAVGAENQLQDHIALAAEPAAGQGILPNTQGPPGAELGHIGAALDEGLALGALFSEKVVPWAVSRRRASSRDMPGWNSAESWSGSGLGAGEQAPGWGQAEASGQARQSGMMKSTALVGAAKPEYPTPRRADHEADSWRSLR